MQKKTVLYIEDDKSLVEILAYNLKSEGYGVLSAFTAEDGFRIATMEQPDVIVLDLMLPDMDGLDLMRLLTSSHRTQHIPIIILTAKAEETDEVVGFELGTLDYIVKPFSVRVFLRRLKSLLRRVSAVSPVVNPSTAMTVYPIFTSRHFESTLNDAFVLMPFTLLWSARVWNHLQSIVIKEG